MVDDWRDCDIDRGREREERHDLCGCDNRAREVGRANEAIAGMFAPISAVRIQLMMGVAPTISDE